MKSKDKLAILGGKPVRGREYPPYNTIDENEKREVMECLDSGVLSAFLGAAGDGFLGGPKVKKLEQAWQDYFGVKYAVSMNSATSALFAAVTAAGIGPGDEVIISPITMTATGTAILMNNAVPVFADVDPKTMNIDPASVKEKITSRTKAIYVVHLTGHPADMDPVMEIAKKNNLLVLGDNAQSPGALYKGRFAGCIEDIGVFSLNCHKTIQCGEGGVAVTDDEELAFRLRLVRNHAENCTAGFGRPELHILGLNLRMTEMEAAVSYHQLKKLKMLNEWRQRLADYLTKHIKKSFDFISPPHIAPGCTHVYYIYHMFYDEGKNGVPIDLFTKAVQAEGIPLLAHYGSLLYRLPIYQDLSACGDTGWPFRPPYYDGQVDYSEGICPNAEAVKEKSIYLETIVRWPNTEEDMADVIGAFEKVVKNKEELLENAQKL